MKKRISVALLSLLILVPAFAVLNEKDLPQTLSVLKLELRQTYKDSEKLSGRMRRNGERQHARLVRMMQQSNELSLMLYSQKQDFTFDMTYALNEVSRQYEDFASRKLPYDDIINRLDIDIDRYDRLIHTLRSLPPSNTVEYVDSLGNVIYVDASSRSSRRSGAPSAPRQGMRRDGNRQRAFQLDSAGCADRDSCIFYADYLLATSINQKEQLVKDSTDYKETADMLKSAYDYAQKRYRTVQTKIFKDGQTPYPTLLKNFSRYWNQATGDCIDKYSLKGQEGVQSQWRGPIVIGFSIFVLVYLLISFMLSTLIVKIIGRRNNKSTTFSAVLILTVSIFAITIMIGSALSSQHFFSMASKIVAEFAWMLAAIFISLVIRLDESKEKKGLAMYLPTILMCLIIISFRVVFIPNSLLNIIFPPILLIFTLYQGHNLRIYRKQLPSSDMFYGWFSFIMMIITTIIALFGYVLLGVQLLIWWFFQLTLLQTVNAVYILLENWYDRSVAGAKLRYIEDHPNQPHKTDEDFISVNWPMALFKKALIPVAIILSIPLSIYMASGVFDLSDVFRGVLNRDFVHIEGFVSLSVNKIVLVLSLFFVFRFLVYIITAVYRQSRIRKLIRKTSAQYVSENQLNLTFAGHMIGIVLWGIYVITIFTLLRIPTSAIKLICAGLATGMGFAMKDVLNNFFYGVQLMSGRLRVGDFIECDGIRGKVEGINYQCTQIVASDGAVMTFPNATLFNKNFKNLTRNHSYELVSFPVGVAYGSDVEQVREVVLKALEPLRKKNKYGVEIIEPKFGIQVRFNGFGDSSVDLSVYQYVNVEDRYTYIAKAKELIYNALNENNIEIPFPQRDVHIKQ